MTSLIEKIAGFYGNTLMRIAHITATSGVKIIGIFLMNANMIGFWLTFIASLGWAIQTFIESHRDLKGRVLLLYTEQQERYRERRNRNLIWLILLCLGFLLQFIGS